jgi:Na+-transporting NADH:ubiquinone oxidoreductase subunit NqrD
MKFQSLSHPFWGARSPLAAFSGGSLLVLASTRFSHALIGGLALLWIYVLTGLALRIPVLPRRGKEGVRIFLSSFITGLFVLILSLLCPILALDSLFFLIFCPLCCVSSGILDRIEKLSIGEAAFQSYTEGVILAALILILALIREPLGYGTLSLPGGRQGILCLINFSGESYLPARILSLSGGAFFLLGYGAALFRRFGGNPPSPPGGGGRG